MNIRKNYERMDERKLDFFGIIALKNLCDSATVERIKYLINLFNSNSSELELFEKVFLINYVGKNRVDCVNGKGYCLYTDGNGKSIILSEEEAKAYTVIDESNNYKPKYLKQKTIDNSNEIVNNLIQLGFKFLERDKYYLAFCEEKNIVFYASSKKELITNYGKSYFFRQPYIAYDGTPWIGKFLLPENCKKEKIDFPLFSENLYLSLYNRAEDQDNPFVSSMKRIAQYPELYEAVGDKNRVLIDNILNEEKTIGKKKR